MILYKTDEVFAKDSKVSRADVRKYIIRESLIPYKCAFCGNDGHWNGKEMSLELDHINGIPNDHRLENLRFLCPNCHATTETYCRPKGSGATNEEGHILRKTKNCPKCGKPILLTSTMCLKCQRQQTRRVDRPSPLEIAKKVKEKGFSRGAKDYGITDNAMRKWCKEYGLPVHTKELIDWLDEQGDFD